MTVILSNYGRPKCHVVIFRADSRWHPQICVTEPEIEMKLQDVRRVSVPGEKVRDSDLMLGSRLLICCFYMPSWSSNEWHFNIVCTSDVGGPKADAVGLVELLAGSKY